jgi:hypothetical protein
MKNQLLLPKSNWHTLIQIVRSIAVGETVSISQDDQHFLYQLGYITEVDNGLTEVGRHIANLILVRDDENGVYEITHNDVMELPATQAILQGLAGVDNISTDQVKMALVMAGMTVQEVDLRITNFLDVLNANSVISYSRKKRTVRLLVSPKESTAPSHIYIDRSRPYSNDMWVREILRECNGSILWLDKYFQKEAFEWLWREADSAKITKIRIVSTTDEKGLDAQTVIDYRHLSKELAAKGIDLEWRTILRKQAHDFHDRWIMDDVGLCFNVPSVHSIKSGQKSELHRSPSHGQLKAVFDNYFQSGTTV